MVQLGNARVNAIYEFNIPSHVRKPTPDTSRSARETFIRLKYAQHAFVHPHPNFERPEVPLPPPTISELLTPSKTPLTLSGGTPKSPTRRSFSPSLRIRSPKLQKPGGSFKSSSRPSSASSTTNISDHSTPADSEEDLRRTGLGGTGSMQLLADNLRKLEKSGKMKNWGGSASLSDRLRNSARKSSRKFSAYAKSKISGARDRLLSKEKTAGLRQVQSDNEDEDMISTSTPLLYSMSASTQNLSSYPTPPPKPPRTFATKRLSGHLSDGDEECELFSKDSDDFSTDILSAIKEMGVLYDTSSSLNDESSKVSQDVDIGLPNGRLPGNTEGGKRPVQKLTKSESSPQLSHTELRVDNEVGNSLPPETGTSPRLSPLKTITEVQSSRPDILEQVDSQDMSVSTTSMDLPIGDSENTCSEPVEINVLPSSAPLRRRRFDVPSHSFDASSVSFADSAFASSEGDLSVSMPSGSEIGRYLDNSSKRYSIMSTTSAEFFSAESSEGSDSKPPSTSASPDLLRESMSSQLSQASAPCNLEMDALRVPSAAASVDDECFSTPPSSPNQLEKCLADGSEASNHVEEVDHVNQVIHPVNGEILDSERNGIKAQGVTNENEDQKHVTSNNTDVSSIAATTSPLHTPVTPKEFRMSITSPKSTPTKRKRSLTVSDSVPVDSTASMLFTNRSKDDNFETENKRWSKLDSTGELISSFSQQDFADIFQRLPEYKNNMVNDRQTVSIPEEVNEEKEEANSEDPAQLEIKNEVELSGGSPSPVPSLRVDSPEDVEAVVIPDAVTPDEVSCPVFQ